MTVRMTRQFHQSVSHHIRLSIPAVLIVVAASLGGSTIGGSTTASAEPREWDVVATDNCVAHAQELFQQGKITLQKYSEYVRNCCEVYGGIWRDGQGCVAPAASAAGPAQVQPGTVQTPTLTAEPPPVRSPRSIAPTVTLAPVG